MKNIENATILTERSDMAQALNFGKNKVFKLNIDTMTGDLAAIEKETANHGVIRKIGRLHSGFMEKDDNVLYFQSKGVMLAAKVDVYDWIEDANNAQAQLLKEGDSVAVLYYSETTGVAFVRLMKAGKPSPHYSNMLKLEDL